QRDMPGAAVLGQCPALGQPGLILAIDTDLDKPLERRVMLDHVVRTTIDPRADVVPILLDQPHDQPVHLGFASSGWRLCPGSGYAHEQQCRPGEAHHGALPDLPLPHHDPSVATPSPRERLATLPPASAGLLCLSHALGEAV